MPLKSHMAPRHATKIVPLQTICSSPAALGGALPPSSRKTSHRMLPFSLRGLSVADWTSPLRRFTGRIVWPRSPSRTAKTLSVSRSKALHKGGDCEFTRQSPNESCVPVMSRIFQGNDCTNIVTCWTRSVGLQSPNPFAPHVLTTQCHQTACVHSCTINQGQLKHTVVVDATTLTQCSEPGDVQCSSLVARNLEVLQSAPERTTPFPSEDEDLHLLTRQHVALTLPKRQPAMP